MVMLVHINFIVFMQVILNKMSHSMLAANFWARSLQQIVSQKVKYKRSDSGRHIFGSQGYKNQKVRESTSTVNRSGRSKARERVDFALSSSQATQEFERNTRQIISLFANMMGRCRYSQQAGEDMSVYMHPLFQTVADVSNHMDQLSFKDASNLIGSSLIDDFSEIDSTDENADLSSHVKKDVSALQERNLTTPFLGPIADDKEYVLVLDLDETLLHFNEQMEKVFVRPHAEKFLLQISKYYELVIFTAGMQDYADWALTHLRGNVA